MVTSTGVTLTTSSECAEALGVPIYLHPHVPPKPVVDTYYSGFARELSALLSTAGFPLKKNGGLKRTVKEYLRANFYGGIVAGE